MSRSYHVTNRQLRRERGFNKINAAEFSNIPGLTELQEKDLKKDAAKINALWKKQAKRDSLKPGWKIRFKNSKVEVI